MTLSRDLAWSTLDHVYRSSIAHQFARYALALDYELLPKEVVHQAKRCLLDALGCAIGAYEAPGLPICEAVVKELGGVGEATVFGSGLRTSALNATLVNCFLVRFLDYNDLGGGGHNSDAMPSILAVAEREKATGRDFLTSLVISYELGARVRDSIKGPSLEDRGWSIDIRGGLNAPPALGRLMGLGGEQIANAIGICTGHCLPLGILDADREEMTMMKNLRFGFVAYQAILACLLAKRGFTGPVRVVEGDSGVRDTILKGDMDLERLTNFSGWRILKTRHKYLSVNGSSLGHVLATLTLVKEHDLSPEDIAAVRIKACVREYNHTTTPAKKYPRNAESADHSAFYMTAIAIKERRVGPEQFKPEKFTDPIVQELIEKITVEPDPSMPIKCFQGSSEITTKDGRQLQKRIDTPHGLGDEPLSDRELEDKFREMASKYMEEQQIQRIFDTIWNLESLDDIGMT
ncbi:MAG: MmgE/PrpD family protein [Thermodesulfobacteriota bacterium]|nr:MmgE/PrpD family protein [Thermodesulfobacteriota bacterium]